MMVGYRLFKFEPWVTSVAVEIFTNQNTVSLKNAEDVLGYQPKVKYAEGLHHVERWLKTERYIP